MGPVCQEFVSEENSWYMHADKTPQDEKKNPCTLSLWRREGKKALFSIKGALGLMLELCQLATWIRETKPIKVGTTGPVFFTVEGEELKK